MIPRVLFIIVFFCSFSSLVASSVEHIQVDRNGKIFSYSDVLIAVKVGGAVGCVGFDYYLDSIKNSKKAGCIVDSVNDGIIEFQESHQYEEFLVLDSVFGKIGSAEVLRFPRGEMEFGSTPVFIHGRTYVLFLRNEKGLKILEKCSYLDYEDSVLPLIEVSGKYNLKMLLNIIPNSCRSEMTN